ncbi:hypothetical protein [Hafnia paralvei]|uniref:hypothetical protein n=1 Tax=Hafnia paralvei TaxID=546367 RepID=UPI001033E461|nr:hypothetical protein [Hafnia paralvei]TBL56453.1 hypothetical protein EYY97_21765 [Hafnia paralvei]
MTYNNPKGDPLSHIQNQDMSIEIGDAVIQLLQREKRVTIGSIIDNLEIKRRNTESERADLIREILTFIRQKSAL